MKKEINLIFDFDSTLIQLETIEVLAEFSLKNNPNKKNIYNNIEKMTEQAMAGDLSFSDALLKRILLLEIKKSHTILAIEYLKNKLSLSIIKNQYFINKHKNNCYIISGGFKEIIWPIVKPINFIKENIYANNFIYNNNILSIDSHNPLSKDRGKNIVASKLKGYNIIIGDGYTDYEVKKYGNANIFIQFIENINRKKLNKNADFIASDFKKIIEFINNV